MASGTDAPNAVALLKNYSSQNQTGSTSNHQSRLCVNWHVLGMYSATKLMARQHCSMRQKNANTTRQALIHLQGRRHSMMLCEAGIPFAGTANVHVHLHGCRFACNLVKIQLMLLMLSNRYRGISSGDCSQMVCYVVTCDASYGLINGTAACWQPHCRLKARAVCCKGTVLT